MTADDGILLNGLMKQIRAAHPSFEGWPQWACDFALDVRGRLKLTDKPLFDDHGSKMEFHDIFMFNFWMQQRFLPKKFVLFGTSDATTPLVFDFPKNIASIKTLVHFTISQRSLLSLERATQRHLLCSIFLKT
jgi:hypothetical protein